MLGFRRRWRRGLLGLYRAALLHTSISSDSLSSFPLPAFLSPACSILFPSFPSDIRGLPPLPPLFQPSLSLPPSPPPPPPPPTALPPSLPHLPPAQPLAHPSRLTYLDPLSSASSHHHPFLNPDTLPPSFSLPPSRAVSLSLPLSLGLYLEMLPPTNKPQTLRSFTQS